MGAVAEIDKSLEIILPQPMNSLQESAWLNMSLENMDGEFWVPLNGYEKLYHISNYARIKRLMRLILPDGYASFSRPEAIQSQSDHEDYRCVSITDESGRQHKVLVHRLMAFTFMENTEDKPFVNHINAVRWDNRIENLEKKKIDLKPIIFTAEQLANERWATINGFENYRVNTLGDVKSLERYAKNNKFLPETILKPKVNRSGYLLVCIYPDDGGKRKFFTIHRLVALAFTENPDNKPYVNHKNCITNDNTVENLEWSTHKENCKHAKDNKRLRPRKGEFTTFAKLQEWQVIEIRELYATGKYSQNQLGKMYNVSRGAIKPIVRRENWKHLLPQAA